MKMKASRLLAGVLVCGAMCAAHGDTWTWTGAEDGYWTNAANWTVNGAVATVPPGRYADPADGTDVGAFNASATFGAVAEGGATTINLDGFLDVSNLVVTAAGPRYTFGTAASQALTIHSTAGVFRVESGALAPTMVAQFGAWRYAGVPSAGFGNAMTPKLVNNSSETLTFPKMFYVEYAARSGEKAIRFEGTGNVKISGASTYRSLIYLDFAQTGGAKLIWDFDIRDWAIYGIRKIRNASGYSNEIEITEGSFFSGYSGMGPFESIEGTFTLSGPGTYIGNVGVKSGTSLAADGFKYVDQQNSVSGTLKVQCRLESYLKDNVYYGGWTHYNYTGTTIFGDNNEMLGTMKILPVSEYANSSARPTFSVASIGHAGVKGPLGLGENVIIAGGGRLLYTGAGETCTRPFCITNRAPRYANAATVDRLPSAVLEQGGTGTLVFNSPVTSFGTRLNGTTVDDATLQLANATAYDAEVGTVLADNVDAGKLNVKKTGTGVWRLKAANTYTGTTTVNGGTLTLGVAGSLAGPVEMRGATFAVECALGDPRTVTLSQFTVAAGANTLAVADGAALTLNGLTVTGGTLDITTVGSGLVKLPGVAVLPAGVTLNGKPAEIDADGYVTERAYAVDHDITAYGGRIPNAPQQTVGITSVGNVADGPITLADGLSSATVATLVQKTSAAATVNLSAGQTLSAGVAAVMKGCGDLTIGSVGGVGTLAAATGFASFDFDNRSTNTLTVLSALSVPTTTPIANVGEGLTRLWWPANWAGSLNINFGTLALTNDNDITFGSTLNGPGTFRKEGSGTWTLSKAQNTTFSGDFVVAGGQVTASSRNVFGDETGALVITNGAQLKVTSALEFYDIKPIHLSGYGPDGDGVVRQSATLTMPNLILDGDTRMVSDNASSTFYFYGGPSSTGHLDMAGHTLTKSGGANKGTWVFYNTKIDNPGPIIYEPYYDSGNNWSMMNISGSKTDLGDASAPPIQLTSGSRISLGSGTRINRNIRFVGDADKLGPEMSFTGGIERQPGNVNTNSAVWAGAIELVNANTWLSFNPWDTNYGDRYITVAGQISGAGGVSIGYGTKSSTKGHVIFTHPNNTYAGLTKIAGGSSASLSVFHLGSIPDWSKINLVNGARVGMFVGDGLFTESDVLTALNASASLEVKESGISRYMPSSLVVDTTYAEGNAFTLNLSDAAITRTGGINLGHDGPGVLTVAGDWTKKVNFSSYNGLLRFYGNDHITLGAGLIAGDYITSDGEVLFDRVGDISFADGACVMIGGYQSVNSFGRMTIRDSRLSRHFAEGRTDWINTYDSMIVGYNGSGVLAVEGSSEVTNNYVLGFSHGWGALYMRGGHMTTLAPNFGNSVIIGCGAYGYFEMSDGAYDMLGNHAVAVNIGGQGVFVQTGGVINHKGYTAANDPFYVGYSQTNVAQVLLAGGVFTNDTDTVICSQPETRVYFTVDGGEYINNRPANANRSAGNSLTIFNLNGGVFGTWDVAKARGTYAEGVDAQAYLNFNGGTFRATGAGAEYSLFGYEGGADWYHNIDRVTVYEGGATIDVPNGIRAKVEVPLSAPTGQGVASVAWSDTGVHYVGAPIVEIIGDGTGASAMAVFDSEYEAVSGIMVTSPGCGYTWAKAVIRYGENPVVTNTAVTLASFASGDFTKKGKGRLTLNVANSYTGDTVIEEGELLAAVNGAIPSGSKVVMKGGTLTLGEGVAMPTAYRFDVLAPSTYPGAFTFPAGATMWIDNLDKADKAHGTYVLATFAGGLSGDLPTLANPEDLPFNWYVTKGTNTIRFRYNRGTILKFR